MAAGVCLAGSGAGRSGCASAALDAGSPLVTDWGVTGGVVDCRTGVEAVSSGAPAFAGAIPSGPAAGTSPVSTGALAAAVGVSLFVEPVDANGAAAAAVDIDGAVGAAGAAGASSICASSASVETPVAGATAGGADGVGGTIRKPAATTASFVLSGAMDRSAGVAPADVSVGAPAALIRVASRPWNPDAASPDDPCGALGTAGAIMDSRAWADMVLKESSPGRW